MSKKYEDIEREAYERYMSERKDPGGCCVGLVVAIIALALIVVFRSL